MRTIVKMWRNGPGGRWNARIRWFEDGNTIRLEKETPDGVNNVIISSKDEANTEWDAFKVFWKEKGNFDWNGSQWKPKRK